MKKQKAKFTKILVYTLLMTMLAIILIAQTYAKYTSSGAGSDNTRVAKWNILLNGTSITTTTDEVEFNIFDTIIDSDGINEEADVEKVEGEKIIAPGTMGSFYTTVKNDSEVTAQYKMSYSLKTIEGQTLTIPLEYTLTPDDESSWNSDISTINPSDFVYLGMGETKNTAKIYWRWAFENGADVADTDLGIDGTAKITMVGKLDAEQVDKVISEELTSLTFEKAKKYVALGDTLDLQVQTNEGVVNPNLTWSVADDTVVSIDVDSNDCTKVTITPKKDGDTVVTVKSADNESITASITVYTLENSVSVAELFNFDVLEAAKGRYVPTGFSEVAGTSLETGLTIQDSIGNQYVWVEVPQTDEVYPTAGLTVTTFTDEEYTAIENDLHTYTSVYRKSGWTDTYSKDAATGLTSTQYTELKQKMLKSVYENGGFYVGKYETGIENAPKTSGSSSTAPTETPVIKQNAYPFNYVTCSQAQTLASGMNSGEYTSSLMFGVQWDLVLKYLEEKAVEQGTARGTIQSALKSDSTSWGNYYNNKWNITNASSKYAVSGSNWTSGAYGEKPSYEGILLSTGASDTFSKQGIYDLAGNVSEWTLENTSVTSNRCATRGGDYDSGGYNYPASYRNNYSTSYYNDDIGFRVALY